MSELLELCLIGSLVAMGLLVLRICDLRLDLRQAKLDGEQRQYWFDQYMDASKQLKQRAAEDLADAARFGEGWKHPTPAAFRAGTAANPVLTPLGHPSRYSMRWKVTPPSRKPVPKPGQIRSVLRFAVWPRKTRSGWFVWLERYWSLEAWTYYRTEYSGWFAWAVFARFTTDGLSPFEVREAAEAHGLEIVGPHMEGDVWPMLHSGELDDFELMVAHPPCTYLAVSGARWFKDRQAEQAEALAFVESLMRAPIERICIENPISIISSRIRKPDQIIQPWQFGHGEVKATCLWLKGLPKLTPTNIVAGRTPRVHHASPGPDRWKERSRTLPGIAAAMAEQWGGLTAERAA